MNMAEQKTRTLSFMISIVSYVNATMYQLLLMHLENAKGLEKWENRERIEIDGITNIIQNIEESSVVLKSLTVAWSLVKATGANINSSCNVPGKLLLDCFRKNYMKVLRCKVKLESTQKARSSANVILHQKLSKEVTDLRLWRDKIL